MISHKLNYSLTTFWEFLIYTEASVEAEDQTKHLAPPVAKHIKGFQPLHEAELEAARQTRKVEAQVARANAALDESLTTLHNKALGLVVQERSEPAFTRLFPDPVSDQVRFGLVEQLEVNRVTLKALEDSKKLYPEAFVKEQAAQLRAAIAVGDAAKQARQANEIKLADLRLRLNDWKQDANTVLTAVESALNNIAADKKLGRKWPRRFFA
jgi:hypothetical protein